MVGIHGVGGIPEPKTDRPAKVRERENNAVQTAPAKDDVVISCEAQAAAKLAGSIRQLNTVPDVRQERVTAAKEHLDRGDYRNPEVVAKVAERISKYLP